MTDKPLFSAEDFPVANMINLPPISYKHAEKANAIHDERCPYKREWDEIIKDSDGDLSLSLAKQYLVILREENARLREALVIAADDIHLEFCGTEHHSCCLRARAALEGKCPEMPDSLKRRQSYNCRRDYGKEL